MICQVNGEGYGLYKNVEALDFTNIEEFTGAILYSPTNGVEGEWLLWGTLPPGKGGNEKRGKVYFFRMFHL